jgi:phosphatidate cytidylyltransferase
VLRDRLLSSAVLISATLLLLWLDATRPLGSVAGVWLIPALLFFALGTSFDIATMLKAKGHRVSRRWVIGATALVALSPCVPMFWSLSGQAYPTHCPIGVSGWIAVGVAAAILSLLFREIWIFEGTGNGALERTLGGVFASVYVGVPMGAMVLIRWLGTQAGDPGGGFPGSNGSATWGLAALITTIAVTKSTDAGAYFTGKAIGKRRLIPRLSPGKTWEGAVGGIATAIAVSYSCSVWLMVPLSPSGQAGPWWGPIVFGTVCAVVGMVGDLAESLVKRETGVKDSGTWLPGLGGVWDVTDSLIGAVIPAWIMLASGLLGS